MQAITLLLPIAGYLIGSISAAIIVCRLMKLPDPRTEGSGNPGATNVLRVGGKKAAAITLIGDALGAVLGHLFPLFFNFKGGKGVATSFGAFFGIAWLVGLLTITTWLAFSLIFRMSSLAALVSLILLPMYVLITTKSATLAACGAVISVLVFIRHKGNIERIFKGIEPKIGADKKA